MSSHQKVDLIASKTTLQDQQAFLARLINAVPEGMFLKNSKGRYVLANRAAAAAYGLPVNMMLGRTEAELAAEQGRRPEEVEAYCESDELILSGQERRIQFDHPFTLPSGEQGWYRTSKVGFTIPGGERWVLGIAIDVSDRVRMERALQESQAFLQQAIDASPGFIFAKDREGRYVLVNQSIEKLYGLSAEEILGKSDLELTQRESGLAPDDMEAMQASDRIVFETNSEQSFEERFTLPDGEERWFHTLKTPIDLPDSADALLGFAVDITEHKQAVAALRESEERHRLLQENAPIGIVTLDRHGRIVDANAMMLQILDVPSLDGLVGLSLSALGGPEMPLARDMRRCIEDGEIVVSEGTWRETDKQPRQFRYHLAPIRANGETIEGVQAIIEDVTAMRRLETHLRQASKLEAIGQMAGGIAHSFNNLLMVINGCAEMALSSADEDHPLYADLQQIRQSGQRAAELTNQLLTFSRRQPVHQVTMDLNQAVDGAAQLMSRVLGEDVQLTVKLHREPALVLADPAQIEQALMNLATNARDAMPGGGKLTLSVEPVHLERQLAMSYLPAGPGDYARLTVRDTGVGMPRTVQDHLFEPFFSTKETGRGTGLGLATVYGIVQELDGGITVFSREGRGTTVSLYVPIVTNSDNEVATKSLKSSALRGDETVVVIEDEEDVRALVLRLLTMLGYTVHAAANAREALALSLSLTEPVDLILVDVVMPDMNGPETVRQLVGPCGDAKVLYMSGYADEVVREKALLDGPYHWLGKPFSLEELAGAVRHALDEAPSRPPEAAAEPVDAGSNEAEPEQIEAETPPSQAEQDPLVAEYEDGKAETASAQAESQPSETEGVDAEGTPEFTEDELPSGNGEPEA